MTKLAIFDLDGTLLNTVEDLGNATNYALEQCGFPIHPKDEYYQMVGRGIYNLFRAAIPSEYATEDNVQRMASYFIPYYDAHKCDCTRPYDGIPEMLKTITDRGVRLAVASNKYQDGAEKLVSHFFGEYDFVKILGQRDGQPIKLWLMFQRSRKSRLSMSETRMWTCRPERTLRYAQSESLGDSGARKNLLPTLLRPLWIHLKSCQK